MLTYYCCGCRAQYPAQPKRCPRCRGRSFSGVDDAAPTSALLDEPAPLVPENLDPALAAAFEESERFRLAAISGRPVVSVPALPAPVLEGEPAEGWPLHEHADTQLRGDDAPPTPRDMPEHD